MGRLKRTFLDQIESDTGLGVEEIGRLAQDKNQWRLVIGRLDHDA